MWKRGFLREQRLDVAKKTKYRNTCSPTRHTQSASAGSSVQNVVGTQIKQSEFHRWSIFDFKGQMFCDMLDHWFEFYHGHNFHVYQEGETFQSYTLVLPRNEWSCRWMDFQLTINDIPAEDIDFSTENARLHCRLVDEDLWRGPDEALLQQTKVHLQNHGRPLPILALDRHMPVPTEVMGLLPPGHATFRATGDNVAINGVCLRQERCWTVAGDEDLSGIPPDSAYKLYLDIDDLQGNQKRFEMITEPPTSWREAGCAHQVEWMQEVCARSGNDAWTGSLEAPLQRYLRRYGPGLY